MAAGFIGLVASPASATTEHCPADYTKIDSPSGNTSGDFGSLSWGGTSLTYDLETDYTLSICLKVSDYTYIESATGAGTVNTPPEGPQGQQQNISYIAYKVMPPTTTTDVCPPGTDNEGAEIPEGQTEESFCNEADEEQVCPEGTDNAGDVIPEGETAESFCNEAEQQQVCPEGTDKAGDVIPEGQAEEVFCADIAGEEVIIKKPGKKPTVAGVEAVAPAAAAPAAAAPAAAAPTAVAAGFGTTATASPIQTIALMLVAGGMLLLMAGAWIGLGRRESGTHAA